MKKEPTLVPAVEITAMASKGYGIGKIDGKVIFVEGAMPGDTADVLVTLDQKKNMLKAG